MVVRFDAVSCANKIIRSRRECMRRCTRGGKTFDTLNIFARDDNACPGCIFVDIDRLLSSTELTLTCEN